MVDPTNVYTSKTGLSISAFTSECHIKGKWLHICWVEGVMLGNHEKRELREGGLCLLETQGVWYGGASTFLKCCLVAMQPLTLWLYGTEPGTVDKNTRDDFSSVRPSSTLESKFHEGRHFIYLVLFFSIFNYI